MFGRSQKGRAFAPVIVAGGLMAAGTLGLSEAQSQTDGAPAADDFKAAYTRPPARPIENRALADLGRLLFWDPRLSGSGRTACVTCHQPYLGWGATGEKTRKDAGTFTSRRSQPLIGIGHVEDLLVGWDGRNPTLESQIKSSIMRGSMSMEGTDTPVDIAEIEGRIRTIPDYVALFEAALPGAAIDIDAIATAIAAYERSIEPGTAPFDRWLAGDEAAISESAKRGFVLFNTKAQCAACHSGWRFTDDYFHDIGTTTTDLGRGKKVKDDIAMLYAFKTPTLRSVALRPPYMHNGSAPTLYDVVVHYEKGGIDRPSRSPSMAPLALTEQERLDLVAFMQTLTGVPEGEAAPKLPGS